MSRVLKLLFAMAVVTFLLLLIPGVRDRTLPYVATWLDVGVEPPCTTYALVLPGDAIFRPLTAAALIRIGLARDVLIPQNPESADIRDGITPPTAQISRRVLEHRGIPNHRIVLLPSQSRTTFDDAQALREYLRGHEGDAAVVTSAFHTRRAAFVFRKVFGADADRLHIVAAPDPGFSSEDWWEKPEGARLILTEYAKLAFYSLRYGGAALWGALGMVVGVGMILRHWRKHQQKDG